MVSLSPTSTPSSFARSAPTTALSPSRSNRPRLPLPMRPPRSMTLRSRAGSTPRMVGAMRLVVGLGQHRPHDVGRGRHDSRRLVHDRCARRASRPCSEPLVTSMCGSKPRTFERSSMIEAGHHTDDHDEHGDAQRDAQDGDQRDDGDERAARLEVAQRQERPEGQARRGDRRGGERESVSHDAGKVTANRQRTSRLLRALLSWVGLFFCSHGAASPYLRSGRSPARRRSAVATEEKAPICPVRQAEEKEAARSHAEGGMSALPK